MNRIPYFYLGTSRSSKVYSTGAWVDGVHTRALERELSEYLGMEFVILTNSGTSSLLAAYWALAQDFNTLTVDPYTFPATYQPARFLRYDVRFQRSILRERRLEPTTLNCAVHLFGQPMLPEDPVRELFIEDVAQAFGAEHDGRKLGTFGQISCFSFYPTKILHTCGHGGAVATNDLRLYEIMKPFIESGRVNGKMTDTIALNLRIDEIKAEFLREELESFEEECGKRREIAARYLRHIPTPQPLLVEEPGQRHVYSTFNMIVEARNEFRRFFDAEGIDTLVYYDESILPEALRPEYRDITGRVVAIPCRGDLAPEEIARIEDTLCRWFHLQREVECVSTSNA
jgi:perosamine synthetase